LSFVLPGLAEAAYEDGSVIERSFIAPREVKVGDARFYVFGDFIGKQTFAKQDKTEKNEGKDEESQTNLAQVGYRRYDDYDRPYYRYGGGP